MDVKDAKPVSPRKAFDGEGIAQIILNVHAFVAGATKTPEMELDVEEARQLAQGYGNVARHYNMLPSEKAADWFNLFSCLGAVYGTRLALMRMKEKPKQPPKPVHMPTAQKQAAAQPSPVRMNDEKPAMPPTAPDFSENDF